MGITAGLPSSAKYNCGQRTAGQASSGTRRAGSSSNGKKYTAGKFSNSAAWNRQIGRYNSFGLWRGCFRRHGKGFICRVFRAFWGRGKLFSPKGALPFDKPRAYRYIYGFAGAGVSSQGQRRKGQIDWERVLCPALLSLATGKRNSSPVDLTAKVSTRTGGGRPGWSLTIWLWF